MQVPKYKYTRKYVIQKINNNGILYLFLKKNRIYNRFINSCLKANTCSYFIDREDFDEHPFMSFSWHESGLLDDCIKKAVNVSYRYNKYRKEAYDEI